MRRNRFSSITISIALLITIVLMGEIGYVFIEDYTFMDAFFMTIITVSTVGFSEVKPLSPMGELFTVFMIVTSFGAFAYAVTSITRFMVDGSFRNYFINKRTERKVNRLSNHVILCGFGRNGTEAARVLKLQGVPFLVLENNHDELERIRSLEKYLYVEGDATDDDFLKKAGVEKAQSLITTLPHDADNLLIVLSARTLNSHLQIISRASHEWSDVKLKRAGANNVIMPDMVGGRRMAKLVASPNILSFLDYMHKNEEGKVRLIELSCGDFSCSFSNKTIGELRFKKISGVNIVGLKDEKGQYHFNPSPDFALSSKDQLFVMCNEEQLAKLRAAVFEVA